MRYKFTNWSKLKFTRIGTENLYWISDIDGNKIASIAYKTHEDTLSIIPVCKSIELQDGENNEWSKIMNKNEYRPKENK